MKRFVVLIVLINILISAVSCTKPKPLTTSTEQSPITGQASSTSPIDSLPSHISTEENNEIPVGEKKFSSSRKFLEYNNMYIYVSHLPDPDVTYRYFSTLRYQYIDNMTEGGHSVFQNTKEPEEGIFSSRIIKVMAIDYNATEKNGNIPVIIMACRQKDAENYSLISFNMATEQVSVILQDTGTDDFDKFYIYGDTIYYPLVTELSPAKHIVKMHSIKTNGSNMKEYSPEFVNILPSISIYNDKIYYTLDTTKDPYMYVADINFKNSKKLLKLNCIAQPHLIKNGYIYYSDEPRIVPIHGLPVDVNNVYRRSLENFEESVPELLVQNVYDFRMVGDNILYYLEDDLVKVDAAHYPYLSPYRFRSYNIKTEKSKVLLTGPKTEEGTFSFIFMGSSKYFVFESDEKRCFMNIETGKFYPITEDII